MKYLYTALIILLCFCLSDLKSQRANNWYFGTNAGISFNSSTPIPISGGQLNGPDNTSSISDQNGNLLFYTDGISVWNSLHQVMANGSGLIGHYTAGQCALIVPIPCNNSKYVIFHVTEFSNPGRLHYTVVDMSLNNGLGDVVVSQKNISLGSGWTEKLCAYYNSSGNNYWVLTHKWNSNQFVALSVNATSIATSSIVSSIGSVHNCGTYTGAHDAMGQLTISPDGTKVLNALTCQDNFEIFNFNSATGVLSNSISIPGTGGKAWGTAFSPNSSKIYVNTIFGQSVLQYDISTYNQLSVLASQYSVVTVNTGGYNFGYMELGPNGKLYIARPSSFSISVINNPDASGSACNFSIAGQSLGNNVSTHGLSRIAYNIPNTVSGGTLSITSNPANSILCLGQTATITATGANSYSWNTGSNSSSIIVSPTVNTVYSASSSSSELCGTSSAAITISVAPIPAITVDGPVELCAGQNVILTASGANSYNWSSGQLTASIAISPFFTTTYSVTGVNTFGCSNSTAFTVNVAICESIADQSSVFLVKAYPNPFNQFLTVELPNNIGFKTIQIVNMIGELVLTFNEGDVLNKIDAKYLRIDTKDLPKGLYSINVEGTSGFIPCKLIKE